MSEVTDEGSRECSAQNRSGDAFFEAVCEFVADADDAFALKYLEESVTERQAWLSVTQLFLKGEAMPVFCGSAQLGMGVSQLLSFVAETDVYKRQLHSLFRKQNVFRLL